MSKARMGRLILGVWRERADRFMWRPRCCVLRGSPPGRLYLLGWGRLRLSVRVEPSLRERLRSAEEELFLWRAGLVR